MDSNRRILDFNQLLWTQNVQHNAIGIIRSVSRVVDKYNDPLHCILISVGCNDLDTKTLEEVEIKMS